MNKLIQAINNSTEIFDNDDEKRRLIIKIKENFTYKLPPYKKYEDI